MEFLETVSLGEALASVAGVLVLLGLLRKAWPWLRRAVRTVDALDALPGLVDEMRMSVAAVSTVVTQVDTIHHEVTPNGGGSMKDELRRQSETLARLDRSQLDLTASDRKHGEAIEKIRDEQIRVAKRLAPADAIMAALNTRAEDAPTAEERT